MYTFTHIYVHIDIHIHTIQLIVIASFCLLIFEELNMSIPSFTGGGPIKVH